MRTAYCHWRERGMRWVFGAALKVFSVTYYRRTCDSNTPHRASKRSQISGHLSVNLNSFIGAKLTVMCFRWSCPRVCRHFSAWRAQRVWPRGQMMTAYLQKASTACHTVKDSFLSDSVITRPFDDSVYTRICLSWLDIGSQCNQSPSPRPHTDTSNPASWSRHLIQQTLMDEGLRLARMVSHDRAGKISLGSEGTHSTGDFANNDSTISCA